MPIINTTPSVQNGDVLDVGVIKDACDTAISAANIANSAKAASEQASADVVRLGNDIAYKQGTKVYANGSLQLQTDIVQAIGSSTQNVMSQKCTTDSLAKRVTNVSANGNYLQISKEDAEGKLNSTNVTVPYATQATNADFAASATKDGNGNNITTQFSNLNSQLYGKLSRGYKTLYSGDLVKAVNVSRTIFLSCDFVVVTIKFANVITKDIIFNVIGDTGRFGGTAPEENQGGIYAADIAVAKLNEAQTHFTIVNIGYYLVSSFTWQPRIQQANYGISKIIGGKYGL